MNQFNEQIQDQSSMDEIRCLRWKDAPEQNRKCNDIICVWVFMAILAVFIISSGYYINEHSKLTQGSNSSQSQWLEIDDFSYVIAVAGLVALVLSLLYVWLMLKKTQLMIQICLFFSITSMLSLSAYCYAYDQDAAAISLLITSIIYIIILNCYKQLLKWGIIIVKSSSELIFNHTSLFLISFVKVIASGLFIAYWLYSLSCTFNILQIKSTRGETNTTEQFFVWYFIFVEMLITILMYYVMVFMVGIACSFWYYKIEGRNYFWQAYRWAFSSQFGSLVFAALTLALIKLARLFASLKLQQIRNDYQSSNNSNRPQSRQAMSTQVIKCLIRCLVLCCLKLIKSCIQNIQEFLKVLNHNSVLIMAITGQSYIQSAKSTIYLIGTHLPMFFSTDTVSNLLIFWGSFLVSGITTFISYLWIESYHISQNLTLLIVFSVFIISILIGGIIFSVIVQAISGLFLLYCMDNRFSQRQPTRNVLSQRIRQAFNFYSTR